MNQDNTPVSRYTYGRAAREKFEQERRATREALLAAGLDAARLKGYAHLTRAEVTNAAGRAAGSLNHVFGTMLRFRQEVMRHAIDRACATVVAQGLVAGDPIALAAPDALKEKARERLG